MANDKPLTKNIKPGNPPSSLKEYEKSGGYEGLRKALKLKPQDVTQEVEKSNLKGRGGAGFNTGKKWSFVPVGDDAPSMKYLVANADEMEPGTFKDRLLMEGDPHQLIEGMIIAAYAIQASEAFIFLRWAYKTAEQRLQNAISEAQEAGYIGKNILGSGFNLEMHIHSSAGRYICGEETGLLNALEGKRAIPRSKPPFPQISGLFGKPTIVNNVETLCNIPHILHHGAHWYHELSNSSEGGTKLYGVSGRVKNPGCWELPLGATMREIIEEHAGGMLDGYKFKGVLPGGASTDFLVEEHMDTPMDFESVMKAGSRLGTGTMVILDDQTCPVGFVHNLEKFFAHESCGWCTPCRDGLPWVAKTLEAMENGEGKPEDMDTLNFHTGYLGMGHTYCALAPGAMEPLQSALKYFKEDFEKHIKDQKCPWR
ncbi:MAG TPA: NADH-quinone oxidoreductase subunit NuoF [Bacteroidales bacterium]|nr:NADH-quinone oxidoreductase subunit NuoF [Bacteroidales bacterium]